MSYLDASTLLRACNVSKTWRRRIFSCVGCWRMAFLNISFPPAIWTEVRSYKPTAEELAQHSWRELVLRHQQILDRLRVAEHRQLPLHPLILSPFGDDVSYQGYVSHDTCKSGNRIVAIKSSCDVRDGQGYRSVALVDIVDAETSMHNEPRHIGELLHSMISFTSCDRLFGYGAYDGNVYAGRLADGATVAFARMEPIRHTAAVHDVCMSSRGQLLYSASHNTVCTWDLASMSCLYSEEAGFLPHLLPLEPGAVPGLPESLVVWSAGMPSITAAEATAETGRAEAAATAAATPPFPRLFVYRVDTEPFVWCLTASACVEGEANIRCSVICR